MILGASLLQHLKAFGSPVCALDPQLQDGKKIPKWQPRLHLGQFLGFSKEHSSAVGLIKNVKTGSATPQFHVAFDECFEPSSSGMSIDLEEAWIDLFKGA